MSEQLGGSPLKALVGGLLMAVGVLIAGLAGLCTITVWVAMHNLSAVPLGLIFGGIPVVVGIAIFLAGRHLWMGGRPKADPAPPL